MWLKRGLMLGDVKNNDELSSYHEDNEKKRCPRCGGLHTKRNGFLYSRITSKRGLMPGEQEGISFRIAGSVMWKKYFRRPCTRSVWFTSVVISGFFYQEPGGASISGGTGYRNGLSVRSSRQKRVKNRSTGWENFRRESHSSALIIKESL